MDDTSGHGHYASLRQEGEGKEPRWQAEEISIQSILSHIYIFLPDFYLLASVTHLKYHRDQNRAAFWWDAWQSHDKIQN